MPDQIEVVKPNDDIIALFQREPLRTVTKAEQVQDLLGQDVLNISVTSVEPLDLTIGQRMTSFGKTYYLNQLPTAQVKGGGISSMTLHSKGLNTPFAARCSLMPTSLASIQLLISRSPETASYSLTC